MSFYGEQIARLNANPKRIFGDWSSGIGIFAYIGSPPLDEYSGCLTQIRNDFRRKAYIRGVYDPELTHAIRNDHRIPEKGEDITVEHLPIFSEWWNKIESLINAKRNEFQGTSPTNDSGPDHYGDGGGSNTSPHN